MNKDELIKKHMSEVGRQGGKTTSQRHGKAHYQKLAENMNTKRREQTANPIYKGHRATDGTIHVTVNSKPLRHISWHSPDGFEWGYSGSAPADLALSILAHYFKERHLNTNYIRNHGTQDSKAWKYHQKFKSSFLTQQCEEWTITSKGISEWLKKLGLKQK